MSRPFVRLLREHRGQSLAYSTLLMHLADVVLAEVPYRHEVLWREKVPPYSVWHYHGEGNITDSQRWSDLGPAGSVLFQRLPRALWLSLLLAGDDAGALTVWLSLLGGARDAPSLDDPSAASEGERLGALLTAFFWSDDDTLSTLSASLGIDEVFDEAVEVLHQASGGPSPDQVDATTLVDLRERWLARVTDRTSVPPVLSDPTRQIWVDVGIMPGKVLCVSASDQTAEEALECFARDEHIGGLDLSGMPQFPLYKLRSLPSARRLRFLVSADLYGAKEFAALQLLQGPLNAWTMQQIGQGTYTLRALLGHGAIGPEGFAQLAQAPALSELYWVSLRGACPRDRGAIAWFCSGRTRHLRALSLVNNTSGEIVDGLKEDGMEALVTSDLSELCYLDLRSNQGLSDRLAMVFAKNQRRGALRHLALEGTGIGGDGVSAIIEGGKLSELEHLDLYRTHVRPEGATAIARSPALRRLRFLRVMNIEDAGLCSLARDASFAGLQSLGLERCRLTSEGVRALAQAPWMCTVRSLDLQSNEIDDEGAAALAASPYLGALERLELYQNALSTQGVRILLGSLPSLRKLGAYGASGPSDERQALVTLRPGVEVSL